MRKLIQVLIVLSLSTLCFAQTPEKVLYKKSFVSVMMPLSLVTINDDNGNPKNVYEVIVRVDDTGVATIFLNQDFTFFDDQMGNSLLNTPTLVQGALSVIKNDADAPAVLKTCVNRIMYTRDLKEVSLEKFEAERNRLFAEHQAQLKRSNEILEKMMKISMEREMERATNRLVPLD
ncbi:MAG: hypothetical protein V1647_04455 [Pseudomonadota bacterium]